MTLSDLVDIGLVVLLLEHGKDGGGGVRVARPHDAHLRVVQHQQHHLADQRLAADLAADLLRTPREQRQPETLQTASKRGSHVWALIERACSCRTQ